MRARRRSLLYLDTNQAVRVFEREHELLYPRLLLAVRLGCLRVVLSDAVVLEIVRGIDTGADAASVRAALARMEALNPLWIILGNLENQEIAAALDDRRHGRAFRAIAPVIDWADARVRIVGALGLDVNALPVGVTELFVDAYEAGGITARFEHWGRELQEAALALREAWQPARELGQATRRVFVNVAESAVQALGLEAGSARGLANALWDDPAVCPGFRLNLETTVRLLWDRHHEWSVNDFFDRKHAAAVPYVDMFVSSDGGLRAAILAFQVARRALLGLPPYAPLGRVEEIGGFWFAGFGKVLALPISLWLWLRRFSRLRRSR
jgi:hypothetical protein